MKLWPERPLCASPSSESFTCPLQRENPRAPGASVPPPFPSKALRVQAPAEPRIGRPTAPSRSGGRPPSASSVTTPSAAEAASAARTTGALPQQENAAPSAMTPVALTDSTPAATGPRHATPPRAATTATRRLLGRIVTRPLVGTATRRLLGRIVTRPPRVGTTATRRLLGTRATPRPVGTRHPLGMTATLPRVGTTATPPPLVTIAIPRPVVTTVIPLRVAMTARRSHRVLAGRRPPVRLSESALTRPPVPGMDLAPCPSRRTRSAPSAPGDATPARPDRAIAVTVTTPMTATDTPAGTPSLPATSWSGTTRRSLLSTPLT